MNFNHRWTLLQFFNETLKNMRDGSSAVRLGSETKIMLITAAGTFIGEFVSEKEEENPAVTILQVFSETFPQKKDEAISSGDYEFGGKSPAYILLKDVVFARNDGVKVNMPATCVFADDVIGFSFGEER